VIALDDALEGSCKNGAALAQVIELHYFGGLTYDQIAAAVGTSAATVHRDIRLARAWLLNEIGGEWPFRDDSARTLAKIQSLFEDSPTRWSRAGGASRERLRRRPELRSSVESLLRSDQRREDPLLQTPSAKRRNRCSRTTGPPDRHARRPVSRRVDSRPRRHEHGVPRRARRLAVSANRRHQGAAARGLHPRCAAGCTASGTSSRRWIIRRSRA
jgi:hypothetical protein